jgi:hypothetical protein
MKKLFLLLALIALTLSSSPAQLDAQARIGTAATAAVEPERVERTVYITRTGAKYHRGDCRYLSQSKIPIKISVAIANGYEPCKVCRP